jgi:hypothetical protein
MIKFWSSERDNAFLPHDSWGNFIRFISEERAVLLGSLLPRRALFALSETPSLEIIFQRVFLCIFLAGILRLILEKRIKLIVFTCVPPVLHLFLSAFQLYPFALRMTLYMIPGIIIICSVGFVFIFRLIFTSLKKYYYFVLLFPILFFLSEYSYIRNHEIKECIKYIKANRNEGEDIYALSYSIPPALYYESIGFAPPMKYENFSIAQLQRTESDINKPNKLHGKNWLLVSHIRVSDTIEALIENLDSCYIRLNTCKKRDSAAYLYDFGE